MNIVREHQTVHVGRYYLEFAWKDTPGSGFSFLCDSTGTVLSAEIGPAAEENLAKCLSGEYAVTPLGVHDYSYIYQEPAQGRCSCGRLIDLVGFTNTCDCGLEYNMSGQLLAPRSQWEDPWDED